MCQERSRAKELLRFESAGEGRLLSNGVVVGSLFCVKTRAERRKNKKGRDVAQTRTKKKERRNKYINNSEKRKDVR